MFKILLNIPLIRGIDFREAILALVSLLFLICSVIFLILVGLNSNRWQQELDRQWVKAHCPDESWQRYNNVIICYPPGSKVIIGK